MQTTTILFTKKTFFLAHLKKKLYLCPEYNYTAYNAIEIT